VRRFAGIIPLVQARGTVTLDMHDKKKKKNNLKRFDIIDNIIDDSNNNKKCRLRIG
jgi:hypothetical protein